MQTFYLIVVLVLFLLAISDLIVGVSNDAVNFLNSAVGAKAATFRTIIIVAAAGVICGCTFSSGMMEVARKGIFHPEHFYFSEIILIFLAVMITDVILLDSFNTLGLPTSTTVSIVFELLGAAVAISAIKIYVDPNALDLGAYINSEKALAIISGILLSVIIAFTAGLIVQYCTRLIFSFDYDRSFRYLGSLWGGLAITSITYFMLIKGAKGASFMSEDMVAAINTNTGKILLLSFIGWTIILQFLMWVAKVNILKIIVLVGTFALAMAFAGNDLVNFIGVPLAGYNAYELYLAGGMEADSFLMEGLAGKVPTPTYMLLVAGLIMTVTLWLSKKARTVIKTSLDLGRQYDGSERFASYTVSRQLVRNLSNIGSYVNDRLPFALKSRMEKQFDDSGFIKRKSSLGKNAPAFDMIRASVTLVVSSILIALGTSLKLPLSTTYVTFMVFMGSSLADGAWGKDSAVFRVSGVLSVIGGWFFTAISAFSVAFLAAGVFYFGGVIAIIVVMIIAIIFIYKTHKYHKKRQDEQVEFETILGKEIVTKGRIVEVTINNLSTILGGFSKTIDQTLEGLGANDLGKLRDALKKFRFLKEQTEQLKLRANWAVDSVDENEIEIAHLYMLIVDYLKEITHHVSNIVKPSLNHVDNNQKPLMPEQLAELEAVNKMFKEYVRSAINIFKNMDGDDAERLLDDIGPFVKSIRSMRKRQIKRIRNHEVSTRNSLLYLNLLGEFRNLVLFSNRLVKVCIDLLINPEDEKDYVDPFGPKQE